MEGQVLENPASSGTEPQAPVGQAAPATDGVSTSQNGPAATQAQSAPAEESFSSIDPSTLPPELQAVYKNLQADYTKKTMSVADIRKKAEAYDNVSKDQRFVDYWKGLNQAQKADYKEQKAEVEKKLGEKISDEDFTKAFNSKEDFLSFFEKAVQEVAGKDRKKIEQLEQKLSVKDAQDAVDAFATEVGQDGKPVRPDFYELDKDSLISGFLQLNMDASKPVSGEEYNQKLADAYTWAKSVSQKYIAQGKAEALQIIQRKAAASTEPPTNAAKGAYTGPDPKNISVHDAIEMAKKGQRVPRDD